MKKKMVCTMLTAVMAMATIGAPVSASAADKEKTIGVVVWDMAQSFEASLAEIAEKGDGNVYSWIQAEIGQRCTRILMIL